MNIPSQNLTAHLRRRPSAFARIAGSAQFPDITGEVRFIQTPEGVIVSASVRGLPTSVGRCSSPIFAFHIHEGGSCSGSDRDPFADALTHYNPDGCLHPYHAGDLPPLFGANGAALSIFLTNRFTVSEIIGKTVIIHSAPDDFTTQPSGNSGSKIACGVIMGIRR